MEAQFLRAVFAQPAPVVIGRRLRPFCLAHRVALTALGSPLMRQDAPIAPADLLVALRVCSARDPFAPDLRPTLRDSLAFWRFRFNRAAFLSALREFVAYVGDHAAHPQTWEKEQQCASDGIPWPLHVVARLVRNGVPERDAWRMSEGRALWLSIAFARHDGAEVSVITERDRLAMSMLDNLTKSNG